MMEAQVREKRRFEDASLLALNMNEGTMSQGSEWPLHAAKVRRHTLQTDDDNWTFRSSSFQK
jgi:hypothetical protein